MNQVKVENFPQLDYATNEALNTLGSNIVFSGGNIRRILVTKRELLNAQKQIEKSGCPVIGAVLNKVEMTRSSKYYHRYYVAYESKGYYRRNSEDEGKSRKKGARA